MITYVVRYRDQFNNGWTRYQQASTPAMAASEVYRDPDCKEVVQVLEKTYA